MLHVFQYLRTFATHICWMNAQIPYMEDMGRYNLQVDEIGMEHLPANLSEQCSKLLMAFH